VIEKSLLQHLLDDTELTTLLGGNKIYFQRVPTGTEMPWVVFSVAPGGVRERISLKYIDAQDIISFEIEHPQMVAGREIAEKVLRRVENYRGDLSDDSDIHITCSTIRSLDGAFASYRYLFNAYVRYKEVIQFPSS